MRPVGGRGSLPKLTPILADGDSRKEVQRGRKHVDSTTSCSAGAADAFAPLRAVCAAGGGMGAESGGGAGLADAGGGWWRSVWGVLWHAGFARALLAGWQLGLATGAGDWGWRLGLATGDALGRCCLTARCVPTADTRQRPPPPPPMSLLTSRHSKEAEEQQRHSDRPSTSRALRQPLDSPAPCPQNANP